MTRPPIGRMRLILNHIAEGRYPDRKALAEKIEASQKTIQRDITYARDQMRWAIEYDREKKGYFLTKPVKDFPIVPVSEGEIVALFIAEKALAQHRGTPFEQPLRAAIRKIIKGLPGEVSVSWQDLESAISFRSIDANPTDAQVFQVVSYAVQSSTEILFEYKKLNATTFERRQARPYHLACVNNQWYVFCLDSKRGEMRTFVLSRMRSVQKTTVKFRKPGDFSVDKYLDGSFGVFSAEGKYSVKLRFDVFAAQLVRERLWHHSQSIYELPDGKLELVLQLTSLKEIEPWVLSWGDHAVVLDPPELRNILAKTIAGMAARYR